MLTPADLRGLSILAGLDAGDLDFLAGLGDVTVFENGARITVEGAPVTRLFFLLEGRASVEVGASHTLVATLQPGSLLGEMSYFSGRPATATVTALGPCRLAEFSQAALRHACEERPIFGLRFERLLMAILQERLSRLAGGGARVADLPPVDPASLKALRDLAFHPLEEEAVARYARFGKRNPFLWKWAAHGIGLIALPSLPEERRLHIRALKLLAAMAINLVDDVADLGEAPRDLDEILALAGDCPAPAGPPALDPLLRDTFAWLWSTLKDGAKPLPEHDAFERMLAFDWKMAFTANRFSRLARDTPSVNNPTESLEFGPHGLGVMVFNTFDLMAAPPLSRGDLRALRETVRAGQTLCELANMIATWRREVPDRDFTSGIFAIGLARGVFKDEELTGMPVDEIVARIQEADLEGALLAEWISYRAKAQEAAARISGFDPAPLVAGYDAVFGMTLAARGSI